MWIKYKHSFAWGYGDEGYIEVPEFHELKETYGKETDTIEKHLADLVASYIEDWGIDIGCSHWSDKYRGFHTEIVEHPDSDWLIKKIKLYRNNAKSYTEKANEYQKILDKVGFITKNDSDIT